MPAGAKHAGPISVWAYVGDRFLGSWSVRAGEPGTIIGVEKQETLLVLSTVKENQGYALDTTPAAGSVPAENSADNTSQ